MSVQSLFSRAFLLATLERAIRSFAASLASLLTASGTGLLDTNWGEKLSVSVMASLVTVLFAIAGGTLGKGDGPSFIGEEKLKSDVTPAPVIPVPRAAADDGTPAAAAPSAAAPQPTHQPVAPTPRG
jgi:acyl-homoserine lactone acylase PvdQ